MLGGNFSLWVRSREDLDHAHTKLLLYEEVPAAKWTFIIGPDKDCASKDTPNAHYFSHISIVHCEYTLQNPRMLCVLQSLSSGHMTIQFKYLHFM